MALVIPDKALEQHSIALGKTGAGKSSATRVLVEHLLDKKSRVVVVTPKADWWGLKLAANGKHAGYPVPVFGGAHADLPLSHLSGKTIAELLGTGDRSAILQMREFTPKELATFWNDFASTLYRVVRGKLYLVIDEVHNFAPKGKVEGEATKMLHWSNKLASEARGLGITLIAASQRPAKVHNDFLTSCETLIAMRLTTHWDRAAIVEWIKGCGDDDAGKQVLNSLAQMKRGDAWVWSPEIEFGPERVHFPMFKTYDSFRPQTAEDSEILKGWADVNLDEFKKKLEYVVKEAEANDPVKLKARIRELESQKALHQSLPRVVDDKAIARAVAAETQRCMKQISGLTGHVSSLISAGRRVTKELGDLTGRCSKIFDVEIPKINPSTPPKGEHVDTTVVDDILTTNRGRKRLLPPVVDELVQSRTDLDGPERKILKAMSELLAIGRDNAPKNMIAGWAGYSPKGGGFNNPLSRLRRKGLVEEYRLTAEGKAAIGLYPAPDQDEINRRIRAICDGPEQKILDQVIALQGGEISKEDLAAAAGYEAGGGGFNNPLGRLHTKGFVEYPAKGKIRAADWLFLDRS